MSSRAHPGLVFEPASPASMAEIMQLESAVFANEQNIPEDLIPLAGQQRPIWWCIRSSEGILGAVAAWIDQGHWHWGRFAIDPRWRGRGIGGWLAACSLSALFQAAAENPDADPDTVHIEARDVAVRILRPLGAEITGPPRNFHGDAVTPMILRRSAFQAPG